LNQEGCGIGLGDIDYEVLVLLRYETFKQNDHDAVSRKQR